MACRRTRELIPFAHDPPPPPASTFVGGATADTGAVRENVFPDLPQRLRNTPAATVCHDMNVLRETFDVDDVTAIDRQSWFI